MNRLSEVAFGRELHGEGLDNEAPAFPSACFSLSTKARWPAPSRKCCMMIGPRPVGACSGCFGGIQMTSASKTRPVPVVVDPRASRLPKSGVRRLRGRDKRGLPRRATSATQWQAYNAGAGNERVAFKAPRTAAVLEKSKRLVEMPKAVFPRRAAVGARLRASAYL